MLVSKNLKPLYVGFIILVLISIGINIGLLDFADDVVFSHALDNISLFEYILTRYAIWSGRVTIDALMVWTINHHWIWRLFIPLSLLLLCTSISRIAYGKISLAATVSSLSLFLMIPAAVNENASWWVTGFYNYLLPVSLATYAISILLNPQKHTITEKSLAILSLFLSCYNEQTSIALILISLIMTLISDAGNRKYSLLFFFVSVINSFILFNAPGNIERSIKESWRWMPGFQDMSLMQKLTFGLDRVHQAVVIHDGIIFGFLCFLSILLIIKKTTSLTKTAKLAIFFLSLHIILMLIKHFGIINLGPSFYNENYISPSRWVSYSRYISYFVILMVLLANIYVLLSIAIKNSDSFLPFLSLLIGCASIAMLSFSPTVFASGMRVLFLFEVALIITCMKTYATHFSCNAMKNSYLTVLLISLATYTFSVTT
ncbi:hypothetical protein [Serratia nevei]|uniref:hypothetical protein n=1 Tax=Serratia nevei TaxID=2703794 RepID=UPI00285A2621|nr:hypothetical protein [Serratia nevei]MDR8482113.1 hypothetical protein [Serratia nevei]